MQSYSKEFRREVLAACDAGRGTREVAKLFGVSESWVRRIKQVRREVGKTAPATTRRRKPLWAADADRIRVAIQESPDLTLSELKERLQTPLSLTTLCRALRRLKLTLKKSPEGLRTGARGCGCTARAVANLANGSGSRASRFYRRNMGQDEHDAPTGSCARGRTRGLPRAARALEDHNVSGRPTRHRLDRAPGCRWGHQRSVV